MKVPLASRISHPRAALRRTACRVLALLLVGLPAAGVAANDHWVFVPVLTSQPSRDLSLSQLSGPFEVEVRAQGQSVLSSNDAALLFETRHSTEPVKLNSDEMSRLLRSISLAARHLALGELPQAQQAMEGVYTLSGPARDYLNREAARARKIFDTCMMTAYLWERDNKQQEALKQMLDCSRGFPGFRPEGRAYPPELRALFEQAKRQLTQEATTTLLVDNRKSTGCGVRLNGIEVGKSPIHFSDVRSGVTRVQFECKPGQPGRIHAVDLKPGDNRLDIDPVFDTAVHSRGALWLQYDDEAARTARIDSDLAEIQTALGAGRVIGLFIDGSTYPSVHVHAIDGPTRDGATLLYSAGRGYGPGTVREAIRALQSKPQKAKPERATRSTTSDEAAPVELTLPPEPVPPPQPASQPDPEPPHQQNILVGSLLAVAGVGGLATGWVYYGLRYRYRLNAQAYADDIVPAPLYRPGTPETLIATGAGALILSFSEYFWLPDATHPPVLAWVAAGVGTAVALVGVGFTLFGDQCWISPSTDLGSSASCSQFAADEDRLFGPMIIMHSLPLLSVPLMYAIRTSVRPSTPVAVDIEASERGSLVLHVRGAF
jgi:hypothetical protein